jgi:hypothetical protein
MEGRPEAGLGAVDVEPRPGDADVLARESAADEVNGPLRRVRGREGPHVVVTPDAGSVLFEDAPGEGVDFDLPRAGHARPLQAEVHPADPGEQ